MLAKTCFSSVKGAWPIQGTACHLSCDASTPGGRCTTTRTKDSPTTYCEPNHVGALALSGEIYITLGRFDEAERSWVEAIRLESAQPTRSPWPALNLGLLMSRLNRLDEAEKYHRESLAIRQRVGDGATADVAESLNNLGNVLRLQGKLAEAEDVVQDAWIAGVLGLILVTILLRIDLGNFRHTFMALAPLFAAGLIRRPSGGAAPPES